MTSIIAMLILFIAVACIAIVWQFVLLSYANKQLDYYRTRLLKMVANDTLVEESFQILCEAYHVEEGDLRNYISAYQERNAS